ncbi:MAG: hypothetical protein HZA93_07835 [Verrucomicrobia bacterium]|nr:hypothetical protein [Verrucomicrobiota bacterium]
MQTAARTLFPFAFASRADAAAGEYSLTDLGEDDAGAALLPVAINDAGEICAAAHRAGGLVQGWLVRGAQREPAGTAMCHDPASCLSGNGHLAGTTGAALREVRAWASHLGAFGEKHWPGIASFAHGVNARGDVVGSALFDAGEFGLSRAFLRTAAGGAKFLTPPHGGTAYATAINDAGDVTVNSTPLGASRDDSRAWLLREDCYIALPGLGGRRAWAAAVTPRGRVTGRALTAGGATHAFWWDDGVTTDLGTLEGGASEALAANDQLTAVGRVLRPDGTRRAFRWTPDDGMKWLDTLVSLPRGWTLREAVGVNARGDIIGTAVRRGRARGFLLRTTSGA